MEDQNEITVNNQDINNMEKKVEESSANSDTPLDFTVPDIKSVTFKKFYDYELFADFDDMISVNKAIFHAKKGLFQVNAYLAHYEAKVNKAKTIYNRQWRREYLKSNQKTDTARKVNADMQCEELEDDVIVFEQLREDFKKLSYNLKIELQTLQTISSNIRQQINI